MADKLQSDLMHLQDLMNTIWKMFKQTSVPAREKMKKDKDSSFYILHENELDGSKVRLYWSGKGKPSDSDYFSIAIRTNEGSGEFDISSNSKVEFKLDNLDLGADSPFSLHIKLVEKCIDKYNNTHIRTGRRTLNFSKNEK